MGRAFCSVERCDTQTDDYPIISAFYESSSAQENLFVNYGTGMLTFRKPQQPETAGLFYMDLPIVVRVYTTHSKIRIKWKL